MFIYENSVQRKVKKSYVRFGTFVDWQPYLLEFNYISDLLQKPFSWGNMSHLRTI